MVHFIKIIYLYFEGMYKRCELFLQVMHTASGIPHQDKPENLPFFDISKHLTIGESRYDGRSP